MPQELWDSKSMEQYVVYQEECRNLALSFSHMTAVLAMMGRWQEAEECSLESLPLSQLYYAICGTAESVKDLAAAWESLGCARLQKGDRAGAEAAFRRDAECCRDACLHGRDPDYQHGLGYALYLVALVKGEAGGETLELLIEAYNILDELVRKYPEVDKYVEAKALCWNGLEKCQEALKKIAHQELDTRRALEVWADLERISRVQAEARQTVPLWLDVAQCQFMQGSFLEALGRSAEAAERKKSCETLLAQIEEWGDAALGRGERNLAAECYRQMIDLRTHMDPAPTPGTQAATSRIREKLKAAMELR